MNTLYLLLNLGSVSVPFLYSFHPRLQLHKRFLWIFISILLTMGVFIPWDVIFTMNGIWGFNDTYFLGLKLFSLPIEEWLFFICIPFACVFTHYALLLYFPNLKLNKTVTKGISIGLMSLALALQRHNSLHMTVRTCICSKRRFKVWIRSKQSRLFGDMHTNKAFDRCGI